MDFISYNQLVKDVRAFCGQLPKVDCVIGVPRSGMLVASLIALNLNIPLSVPELPESQLAGKRIERREVKKILLVDDYIVKANGIKEARKLLKGYSIVTAAVYAGKPSVPLVEHVYKIVTAPVVFEWNMYNRWLTSHSCMDLDGVLCRDPKKEEYSDPAQYLKFIKTVKPFFQNNNYPIHSIVTARYEKFRPQTEEWLKKSNIKYNNLIMRAKHCDVIEYKSNTYKQSKTELFVESSTKIGTGIFEHTGLPVICTDTMQLKKRGG